MFVVRDTSPVTFSKVYIRIDINSGPIDKYEALEIDNLCVGVCHVVNRSALELDNSETKYDCGWFIFVGFEVEDWENERMPK